MPVNEREWREPSRAVEKDQCGNAVVRTRFRIRARTHDGMVLWSGWFESREDFDAFLWAIARGTLPQERGLWDLPTPMWPDLDPGLLYDFATVSFLTATSASNYSTPLDWNASNNSVEGLGAGSHGVSGYIGGSPGGGGGAYAKATNISISGSVNYRCGTANGTSGSGTSRTANTYFKDASTLVAAGAAVGAGGTGVMAGGSTANSVGNAAKYKGGDGGDGYTSGAAGLGGGGGGGAGPNGAGGNGSAYSNALGGSGNAGAAGGGTGGANNSGAGGNGTWWQSSPAYGPGGGGGGSTNSLVAGGAAGTYGAGGGGGSYGGGYASGGGGGKQGLIIVTYEPRKPTGFNMPLLGM